MKYSRLREKLVNELVAEGVLKTSEVINAFRKVPRELFVKEGFKELAYVDSPLPIGFGQTISAPSMVAIMTEELRPVEGNKVLEVGTGSGYQAAVLAELVKPEGHVWSVEIIPELASFAERNLKTLGYGKSVTVVSRDGSVGLPENAPYDRIMVTAASPDIPKPLLKQLKCGGRLVIPVGEIYLQTLKVVVKDLGCRVIMKDSVSCVFVPLVGEHGFRRRGLKLL